MNPAMTNTSTAMAASPDQVSASAAAAAAAAAAFQSHTCKSTFSLKKFFKMKKKGFISRKVN